MKIRLDFVSNSSSSSFMLVGKSFSCDEIENAWNTLHPDKEFEDVYDLAYDLADELCLRCESGISNYYDEYVFGLLFDDMNDDETKHQFKQRILEKLNKAFPNLTIDNISECIDGGYEG